MHLWVWSCSFSNGFKKVGDLFWAVSEFHFLNVTSENVINYSYLSVPLVRNVGYKAIFISPFPGSFNCRLGGTPISELMIATGKAVPKLQLEHGLAVDRVYTGSFMTSLDMAGLLSQIMTFCIYLQFIEVLLTMFCQASPFLSWRLIQLFYNVWMLQRNLLIGLSQLMVSNICWICFVAMSYVICHIC